jgi:hypothetical protein
VILKASQRGSGQNLAVHLMRTDDNEHVLVHEMRGFASDNLADAFKEAEAASHATKCKQYLFSLSLSPPANAHVPVEEFELAIDRAEKQLGLQGQPRAVVFHEKEGRRHAHCVWSRIDADTMTARQMSFFKHKLTGLSRDLYLEHGWKLPRGLENALERNPTNFSLAEWQQAKRSGIDPRWTKQAAQECWAKPDTRKAFENSLRDRGLFLAKGDKRGFVLIDHQGDVHSLPRVLDLKTKDVRQRLGDGDDLASVDATRKIIAARMTPALRQHVKESRERFQDRSAKLGAYKEDMTRIHRAAREKLVHRQQEEKDDVARANAARLPKGLRGFWQRLTGEFKATRKLCEAASSDIQLRHVQEHDKMVDAQRAQRDVLQERFRDLRHKQAEELVGLRADIGRYLKLSSETPKATGQSLNTGLGLKLSTKN